MAGAFSRIVVGAAVFLLLTAGAAMADTLSFVDGKTVTGSFVYDATNNTIVSFNFTSTAFGGTTFNSATPQGQCFGVTCGIVLTNQDGNEVIGFDAAQPYGAAGELDLEISCGGVANCLQLSTNGNSLALASGAPNCPNPNSSATGFCIPSEQQYSVPECLGVCTDLLAGNNFLTIVDPPNPGSNDVLYTLTLSTTSTGKVLSGNGGNNNGVPEPSTLLLSALGLGALALKRFYA